MWTEAGRRSGTVWQGGPPCSRGCPADSSPSHNGTATGFDTEGERTTTVSPLISASALTNAWSGPAMAKPLSAPSFASSPPPRCFELQRRWSSNVLGGGLEAKDGALKGFAIAGPDHTFVNADAQIKGDTVVVRSFRLEPRGGPLWLGEYPAGQPLEQGGPPRLTVPDRRPASCPLGPTKAQTGMSHDGR